MTERNNGLPNAPTSPRHDPNGGLPSGDHRSAAPVPLTGLTNDDIDKKMRTIMQNDLKKRGVPFSEKAQFPARHFFPSHPNHNQQPVPPDFKTKPPLPSQAKPTPSTRKSASFPRQPPPQRDLPLFWVTVEQQAIEEKFSSDAEQKISSLPEKIQFLEQKLAAYKALIGRINPSMHTPFPTARNTLMLQLYGVKTQAIEEKFSSDAEQKISSLPKKIQFLEQKLAAYKALISMDDIAKSQETLALQDVFQHECNTIGSQLFATKFQEIEEEYKTSAAEDSVPSLRKKLEAYQQLMTEITESSAVSDQSKPSLRAPLQKPCDNLILQLSQAILFEENSRNQTALTQLLPVPKEEQNASNQNTLSGKELRAQLLDLSNKLAAYVSCIAYLNNKLRQEASSTDDQRFTIQQILNVFEANHTQCFKQFKAGCTELAQQRVNAYHTRLGHISGHAKTPPVTTLRAEVPRLFTNTKASFTTVLSLADSDLKNIRGHRTSLILRILIYTIQNMAYMLTLGCCPPRQWQSKGAELIKNLEGLRSLVEARQLPTAAKSPAP